MNKVKISQTQKANNDIGVNKMANKNLKRTNNAATLSKDILQTAMKAFAALPIEEKHASLHIRFVDPHTLELQVNAEQEALSCKIKVKGVLPMFDEIEVCTASVSAALARCDRDSVSLLLTSDSLLLDGCFIPAFPREDMEENMIWADDDDELDEYYNGYNDKKLPAQFFDLLALAAPFAAGKDVKGSGITVYEDCIIAGNRDHVVELDSSVGALGIIPLRLPNPAALLETGYRGECIFRYSLALSAAQFCAGPWVWTAYGCSDETIPAANLLYTMPPMPIHVTISKEGAARLIDYLPGRGHDVWFHVNAGSYGSTYLEAGAGYTKIPAAKSNDTGIGLKAHIYDDAILPLLRMGCTEFWFSCGSVYFTAKSPAGRCICRLQDPAEPVFNNASNEVIA